VKVFAVSYNLSCFSALDKSTYAMVVDTLLKWLQSRRSPMKASTLDLLL